MNRKLLDELVDRLADAAVDRVEATLGIGPQVAPDPARGYAEALAHRQGAPAPVRQPAAGPHLSDVVEQFVRLSKADLLRYYEALLSTPK